MILSDNKQDLHDLLRKSVPCQVSCPLLTDVPSYIGAIKEGQFTKAYDINLRANFFPGILGYICTRPCELSCRHGYDGLGAPVQICQLKKAASLFKGDRSVRASEKNEMTGKRVAVIGAGPAGVAAARTLANFGHEIVVYEAQNEPGGMLTHGIPSFRLPTEIAKNEIAAQLNEDILLRTGVHVGQDIKIEELKNIYDALLFTIGCQLSKKLYIPGAELKGVLSGLTFLSKDYKTMIKDKEVVIVGDGFTAADCAVKAMFLKARKVIILSHSALRHIPFTHRGEENYLSKLGVHIFNESSILRVESSKGKVKGVTYASHHYRKSLSSLSTEMKTCRQLYQTADIVITAIGQETNEDEMPQLQSFKNGSKTTGIYTAGDCANGPTNVISAIGDGKDVAYDIHYDLIGKRRPDKRLTIVPQKPSRRNRRDDFRPQVLNHNDEICKVESFSIKENIEKVSEDKVILEASRCYDCSLLYFIDVKKCLRCFLCMDIAPYSCIYQDSSETSRPHKSNESYRHDMVLSQTLLKIDQEKCIRCDQCRKVCPTECITTHRLSFVDD